MLWGSHSFFAWAAFCKGFWLTCFSCSTVRSVACLEGAFYLHSWLICENQTHALLCVRRISNFQEKEMNQTKHLPTFVHIIQALLFYWWAFIDQCFRRILVSTISNEQFGCDFNTAFDFKKNRYKFFNTQRSTWCRKFATSLIDERLVTMRLQNTHREPPPRSFLDVQLSSCTPRVSAFAANLLFDDTITILMTSSRNRPQTADHTEFYLPQ